MGILLLGQAAQFSSNRNFVAEGDSITDANISVGSGYANAANTLASPTNNTFTNKAVSGSTVADLVSRAAAVDALLVPAAANILSVLIGANSFGDGNPNALLATIASYCDARRAAGWYVILCTVLPRGAPPSQFETDRSVANPELRLWATNGSIVSGKHCDRICDFAADPVMGISTGATNTTYFAGDQTHPTFAGQGRMRDIFWPVLDASMRNDTSSPTIRTGVYDCETGSADLTLSLRADRGVVWSIAGGTGGLSLSELSRLVLSSSVLGAYTTTLTATDGNGRSTSVTFTWTVSDPPIGYGPNLLTNPKALNGIFAWGGNLSLAFVSSVNITAVDKAGGGKEFRLLGVGDSFPQAIETITVINGKTYKADGVFRKGSGPNACLQTNNSNTTTTNATDTAYTNSFVMSGTSTQFFLLIFGGPVTGDAYFSDLAFRQQLP